jgi:hypothetical protein
MSKPKVEFKPLSLSQHFNAPDEFVGWFGWLCGYSADASFLEDAVIRFRGQSPSQRAYEGRVALALMLDPGNPQISPTEVPGVLHLGIVDKKQPFRLLHAKVAILGFRHESNDRRWLLRLIVSTGNWTRATLEESLDLTWTADVSNDDIREINDEVRQVCADFRAAWAMLDWLRGKFDTCALQNAAPECHDSISAKASRLVEKWIGKVTRLGHGEAPRFVDNRSDSLLALLPEIVTKIGTDCGRNYLAMGSGFYEPPGGNGEIPSVLKDIVNTLKNKSLLTRSAEIDVFVNPRSCQAIAGSVPTLNNEKWKVRAARTPAYFSGSARTLHAKFIFSANWQKNSNVCNSSWLYLGSGNLTGSGFARKMNAQNGNLEAGVVFTPGLLKWEFEKDDPPERLVTNRLPMQWDKDDEETFDSLTAGGDMPDREWKFFAGPVACLLWIVDNDICWLRTLGEVTKPFDILGDVNHPCPLDPLNGFLWSGPQPREVQIRWLEEGRELRAIVPVIDKFGRIASTILPKLGLDEAWWQLADFPLPPEDEDLPSDGGAEPIGLVPGTLRSGTPTAAEYPVRKMMQFIENIAAKQTQFQRCDWSAWCAMLEQCLIQAAGSPELKTFASLNVNPLSPLFQTPFRPEYAETTETTEGRRYEDALKRVEAAWNVAGLPGIGVRT